MGNTRRTYGQPILRAPLAPSLAQPSRSPRSAAARSGARSFCGSLRSRTPGPVSVRIGECDAAWPTACSELRFVQALDVGRDLFSWLLMVSLAEPDAGPPPFSSM